MIMVPSNHLFFQYCDSNFGLFSIAPFLMALKVIALPTIVIAIVVALSCS
jgi:hypothetical protein